MKAERAAIAKAAKLSTARGNSLQYILSVGEFNRFRVKEKK